MLHKLFHLLPPETAHNLAIWALSKGHTPKYDEEYDNLEREVLGLKFKNPIGMAAGFDKNAQAIEGLFNLGFGFVEVGTVTPKPQSGNPKPRIFRLSRDKAIINRLGFNNLGIDAFLKNVKSANKTGILGINIGANKDTENFIEDYEKLIPKICKYADYITINISSPNTPGLRELQKQEQIKLLVQAVKSLRNEQKKKPPLLVKIAPDLNETEVYAITDILLENGIDGVIATNTTISRPNLKSKNQAQQGGLSGAPLRDASTEIVRKIHSHSEGRLPIIAVGGVFTARDVLEKLEAGASLVQIYTGLIYEGPKIVKNIKDELAAALI
ncbi:MAG: dihydroorotate dehydrogenase (quinone) [Alphaproteobacteria bacterium CG11_big_fil_rev_8_21_14_0_20_44_7]|nr:MAG: dihydroorotate dehydrogenase (quinone) [Alphaproteobacteria bacterium CG11_big_fil_rev_8_21_14_0_20_44_7]